MRTVNLKQLLKLMPSLFCLALLAGLLAVRMAAP
jgi:hypothetical protein